MVEISGPRCWVSPSGRSAQVLPVALDEGVDLNAYYDRKELNFFHQEVNGVTYYSGESPDVVCHEMGHACLDAHRPELWGTPFIEAGAFHESFADQSAVLSQLQLKTVRQAALAGLKDHKASQLSRLAEQLGFAIRQVAPTAVDKDCLRNAYNKFEYVDPQTLPNSAPPRNCALKFTASRESSPARSTTFFVGCSNYNRKIQVMPTSFKLRRTTQDSFSPPLPTPRFSRVYLPRSLLT